MSQFFKFLKIVLTDFRNAAMLAPTSKYAIARLLKQLAPGTRTVIEYGPGDGVITRKILDTLPPDGRLIAVEINPEFVACLQHIKDPRLEVIQGDVLELARDFPKVDAIISGIPFSFFSAEKKEAIVRLTAKTLKDGGVFIPYQYSPLLQKSLRRFFDETDWTMEIRNLPSVMFIMTARRPKRQLDTSRLLSQNEH